MKSLLRVLWVGSVVAWSCAAAEGGLQLGDRVRLGGEAGAGFFDTGNYGAFPNSEFRIDEAKLFLDAKISDNVFFFTEFDLTLRETPDDNARVAEIYVEVEGLEELWGGGDLKLSLRAGRVDIPFGEEYLTRDAADNPFISHTLADVWGVDEGAELFGRMGMVDYTLAVQNGSYLRTRDGDPDKSVTARVGIEPAKGWRFSASAMRTGDQDGRVDEMAEVWFGNAYIGWLGSTNVGTFHLNLAQLDASFRWDSGHAAAAVGAIEYGDDDIAGDNATDAIYWSAEIVQQIARGWYGGLRYSWLKSDDGFPVPGNGDQSDWQVDYMTDDIWRLSGVVGWRVNERLVWKTEYTLERGTRTSGEHVEDVDMFATEIAVGF